MGKGGGHNTEHIEQPRAALGPCRPGIGFMPFGTNEESFEQVKDITTGIMVVPDWIGWDKAVALTTRAARPTWFVIEQCLFAPTSDRKMVYRGDEAAAMLLRTLFDYWHAYDALKNIEALFGVDEPEREKSLTDADIQNGFRVTRAVCAEYEALKGMPIAMNFGDGENYVGMQYADIVSIDAYNQPIFSNGLYSRFRERCGEHQRVALIIGVADPFNDSIDEFYRAAQSDMAVGWLIPFIAIDHYDDTPEEKHNHLGFMSNGARDRCIEAGTEIVKAYPPKGETNALPQRT